jgi:hypothetical protein
MKVFSVLVGIVSLVLGQAVLADDDAKAPSTQPIVVSLSDKQALDANVGKDIVVQGMVSDAQWSSTGRVFIIKFAEGDATQFQGAMFAKLRDDTEKAFNGDLSNAFEGSKIQIEGKLQTYREHPEILINDPKQITILVKGPGNSPHAGSATRPSVQLYGIYGNLTTLSDVQRTKIAAIQKDGHDAELALEKKIRDDEDAKIAEILDDKQKEQVKSLQDQASHRGGDGD